MGQLFQDTIEFVKDLYGRPEFVPLHVPRFLGREKEYVLDTLDSTYVSSVGAYVDRFEMQMADLTHTTKAVAVVNGTAALQVALRLAGVDNGSLVITQALTFVATANAIVYNQAEPVFIDVDRDTMGLSSEAVRQFLCGSCELRADGCYHRSTGKRIAACVPMHTFGFPCRIDELIELCDQWQIPVVEDAAESLGSLYKDRPTGSFGKLGVFSFNGNKIITSGGGGAIVTNDEKCGLRGKYLTTTAKKPHRFEYFHNEVGYNFRMPNLNAALACGQLENIETFVEKKRAVADKYNNFFADKGFHFRSELPDTRANYWLMCLELSNREERDVFLRETNDAKVMTRPIWKLMYRLPMYDSCIRDEQRNAEYLESRIVNLPSSICL